MTGPLKATIVPGPKLVGPIVPEMLEVWRVKFAVILVPLPVTVWLAGLNICPNLLGVTV